MDEFCQMHHAQGLITTCSYCKSIRDSEGFWQPIERFLMQHSTLNFSHGICPECMNEHFPDVQSSAVERSRRTISGEAIGTGRLDQQHHTLDIAGK